MISKRWLKEKEACQDGYEWSLKVLSDGEMTVDLFLEALVKEKKYDWAYWILERTLTRKQAILFAVFCAEQVIDIYEKKYPLDKRPRQAIEAVKAVLNNDTKKNREAIEDAARSARSAADAASAAYARSAAYAASASAYAATTYAAYAAYATYAAYARSAARSARSAAYATYAKKRMQLKIINYGIELVRI